MEIHITVLIFWCFIVVQICYNWIFLFLDRIQCNVGNYAWWKIRWINSENPGLKLIKPFPATLLLCRDWIVTFMGTTRTGSDIYRYSQWPLNTDHLSISSQESVLVSSLFSRKYFCKTGIRLSGKLCMFIWRQKE